MPKVVTDSTFGTLEIPHDIEAQLLAVELIPVKQLMVDAVFQRTRDDARISKMAKEWNWLACGQLVVSLRARDGDRRSKTKNVYSVLDGQQRMGAIIQQGYKDAPCRVYADLTEKQEAELFELLNKAKQPTFNDLFKSRLSRGEEVARNIELATKSVGFFLDPGREHKTSRHIQTMLEMERLYNAGKSALIMDTLRFIHDVFPNENLGHQQMIIAGVAMFLQKYGTAVRLDEMKAKMIRLGQIKMTQQAFQYAAARGRGPSGNSRAIAYSEAMLMVYNTNRTEAHRVASTQR